MSALHELIRGGLAGFSSLAKMDFTANLMLLETQRQCISYRCMMPRDHVHRIADEAALMLIME